MRALLLCLLPLMCGCEPIRVDAKPQEKVEVSSDSRSIVEGVLNAIVDRRSPGRVDTGSDRNESGAKVENTEVVVIAYVGDERTCLPCRRFKRWEESTRGGRYRFEYRQPAVWVTSTPTFHYRDSTSPTGWRYIEGFTTGEDLIQRLGGAE